MEMTLNLPRNYVEIEEEEMMYLDGGAKFTGAAALNELTNMAATVLGYAGSAVALGKMLTTGIATSTTGIGAFVAFAAAIGMSWAIGLGLVNSVMLGMAAFCYMKYRGFNQTLITSFGQTLYTSITRI